MSWLLLYGVAVSGVALSVGMIALFYLHRVTERMRELRDDLQLMGRCLDAMADDQRRSHWQMLHPEQQRDRRAA